jgi:2-C-methyl-D-erythritol 2,4-cyclodiphosphate synthase
MDKLPFRIGSAYDIHRLDKGDMIFIGETSIPCKYSIVAHSDGDIIFHAVGEAVLGAVAEGDLGTYFPPDDPDTVGMDSKLIIDLAMNKAKEHGYTIGNIDVSIFLEEPKLKPFIPKIRENVARFLHTDISAVSVKACTNEGLDSIGEKKAIGCFATVLLIAD